MTANPKRTDHYFSEKPQSAARFGTVHANLRGRNFEFTTASSVFSTKRIDTGTRILIENMNLPTEGCVLDIGCGYGAVGITAAKLNPALRVVLTDINRRAVLLARQNAQKNRVRNVDFRQGNLYTPVQDICFNTVLSNPPVSAGMQTVQAIISGAPAVLESGGSLQMVVRSKIGKKTLPDAFTEAFGNVQVLAIESGYRVLMGEKE
ncbi:MAG: methyltransferase [Candidatus Bathyarchaeota archaeon]|nr:methyltransferase [Candidatus Bathyarchaeota archaeon]